jgi:hypothetical protein
MKSELLLQECFHNIHHSQKSGIRHSSQPQIFDQDRLADDIEWLEFEQHVRFCN